MTSDPQKMQQWISEDRVHFGVNETSVPCIKSYLKDREFQAPYSVFYQDGRAATKRLRDLMGADCFDFPKDETVLQELIGMMTSGSDLIMDFFAGSGTTGHAVMTQNEFDGGNRRFVLVQLPEPLDPEDKNQQAAAEYCDDLGKPRNIAELTKERLRRAADRVREENPKVERDLGFRVFKLDSTNIREWDTAPEDLDVELQLHTEHIKEGRSESDILYELLLKLGLDLCVPMEQRTVSAGKRKHRITAIGGGVLMACLSKSIPQADVETLGLAIVSIHKELVAPWKDSEKQDTREFTAVFRDSAFEDDVAKTNMAAILTQHGFTRVRSI